MSQTQQNIDAILLKLRNKEISPVEGARLIREIQKGPVKDVQSREMACASPMDIAIIGIAGRFPGAHNVDEYWANLQGGLDSISEIPEERWDVEQYFDPDPKRYGKTYCKYSGVIPDAAKFDPSFFNILPLEAELMDPQQRLFLEESWRVFEDAGYAPAYFSGKRCGVFVGTGQGDYDLNLKLAGKHLSSQFLTGTSPCFSAARIAYFLNLTGPCMTIDTACSSSLVAIHQGCQSILNGESEVVLAGGVCILASPLIHITTSKAGMLARDGRCKAFDNSADGFVPSDGAGVVLLKPLAKALADHDFIYGVIKGSGVNQDGKTNGITAPSANSQARLIMDVYRRYQIDPADISFLEAHGTGTKLGDPIEISALTRAFRHYTAQTEYCAIGSVKTNIGHALAASGVAGLIKVLLCLKNRQLVPSLHFNQENEHIRFKDSPFVVNTVSRQWRNHNNRPRLAAISSFGLSGTNCHMVIQEAPEFQPMSRPNSGSSHLIPFSAKTGTALYRKLGDFQAWLGREGSTYSLEDIVYTLQTGRTHFSERVALVAASHPELQQQIGELLARGAAEHLVATKPGLENTSPEAAECLLREIRLLRFENGNAYREKLLALAEMYAHGLMIDWSVFDLSGEFRRVPLPTYPFEGQRFWIPYPGAAAPENAAGGGAALPEMTVHPSTIATGDSLFDTTVNYLKGTFAAVLKLDPEKLDLKRGFEELGMDSILITQLNGVLEEQLGAIPATLLFTYKNLSSLAEYLIANNAPGLAALFNRASPVKPSPEKPLGSTNLNATTDDIAIIGVSGRYPLAANLEEYWENLKTGRDCIGEIPPERWDVHQYSGLAGTLETGKTDRMYCKWGGFLEGVDQFDPSFFNISPYEARLLDPNERLFLQVAWSCLEDAAYTKKSLADPERGDRRGNVGVFAGVSFNNYQLFGAEEVNKGRFIPIPSQIFSVANRISYLFNFSGPSITVDTACSSSLSAIHLACESIRRGECAMAIAGGVNLSLHPSKYITLCAGQFGSSDGRCRAFGEGGDGYVPSEGVGAVVLKPLSQAVKDGDYIYAKIKSTAVNHGGKTYGYTVPNPVAQAEVIKAALDKGGINPRTISYIEAHGTGTNLGDPIEVEGLTKAFHHFTTDQQFCAIGSVKSNIGHGEAAAGIAQLTKVLLQMKYKMLVPSLLHSQRTNPNIHFENTPFVLQSKLEEWKQPVLREEGQAKIYPRRAGVSSFGVGGVNVHVIVEENDAEPQQPREDSPKDSRVILVLAAKAEANLRRYVQHLKHYLKKTGEHAPNEATLENIAYTLQIGREAMPFRLALTAGSIEEAIAKLAEFLLWQPGQAPLPNVFFGQVDTPSSAAIAPKQDQELQYGSNPGLDLDSMAEAWVKGVEIDWHQLYKEGLPRRIPLPTYPFSQERYWVVEKAVLYSENQTENLERASFNAETLRTQLAEVPESERETLLAEYLRKTVGKILEFPLAKLPQTHQGFFDMGMDSVQATKLSLQIEADLEVELYATAIFDYSNIRQLSRYVLKQIQNGQSKVVPSQPAERTARLTPGSYETVFYRENWKPADLASDSAIAGDILVFDCNNSLYRSLREKLRSCGRTNDGIILVKPGEKYREINHQSFEINPELEADYETLIHHLNAQQRLPGKILHFWSQEMGFETDEALHLRLKMGVYSLFLLTKQLITAQVAVPIQLLYLFYGDSKHPQPLYEGVSGFAKSIPFENPKLTYKTLELRLPGPAGSVFTPDRLCQIVAAELFSTASNGQIIRYDAEQRWEKRIEAVELAETAGAPSLPLRNDGVYLITGGAGGLGLIFAGYIAGKIKAKIVLAGRSDLNPAAKLSMEKLAALGSENIYLKADVSQRQAAEQLIAEIKIRFGRIDGVIHAAGLIRDSFIVNKTRAEMTAVLSPKVFGTVYLDEATQNEELDFFVMFSSLAAVMGNAGQCDYAYSNSFMDHYGLFREGLRMNGQRHGKTVVINWPLWRDGGMKIDRQIEELGLKKSGMALLETAEGLRAFEKAFNSGYSQVGVLKADLQRLNKGMALEPVRKVDTPLNWELPLANNQSALTTAPDWAQVAVSAEIDRMSQGDLERVLQEKLEKLGL